MNTMNDATKHMHKGPSSMSHVALHIRTGIRTYAWIMYALFTCKGNWSASFSNTSFVYIQMHEEEPRSRMVWCMAFSLVRKLNKIVRVRPGSIYFSSIHSSIATDVLLCLATASTETHHVEVHRLGPRVAAEERGRCSLSSNDWMHARRTRAASERKYSECSNAVSGADQSEPHFGRT